VSAPPAEAAVRRLRSTAAAAAFFAVAVAATSQIGAVELKDLTAMLRARDAEITRLKADYRQRITFTDLDETYSIVASFVYVKPDWLRLDITAPMRQTIVVSSGVLWVDDRGSNTRYRADLVSFTRRNASIFPLILSGSQRYDVADLIRKLGMKVVTEEPEFYVVSTRYARGRTYTDRRVGLRPGEVRFIMWIRKSTLFPERVHMISEKYIVETTLSNYVTEFDPDPSLFVVDVSTDAAVQELEVP